MRRLDRAAVIAPDDWEDNIRERLPDKDLFDQRATEFEALPINDPVRRAGFRNYAPEVLPLSSRKRDFPTVWNSVRRIKTMLQQMSAGKCAYCEQNLNARRLIQVEHFKPKSLFPSLCYDVGNYFAACGGCNGQKSDHWPETGAYVRPDQGRPERKFRFAEDGSVTPSPSGGDAERTIRDFGLDRHELVAARRILIVGALDDVRALLAENAIPASTKQKLIRAKYRRVRQPTVPYSVAIAQNLKNLWTKTYPGKRL